VEKLIETINLYTDFHTFEGTVKALNGVDIFVRKGETYGLVGESGCGKSVTVRSILRIVQSPGRIRDGKILLYFSEENKEKSIDILTRPETYMESVRGSDISMIFQEASSSLNPVFSIGEQVGESIFFHRLPEILEAAIDQLKAEVSKVGNPLTRTWKSFSLRMLEKELSANVAYDKTVAEIDERLYLVESLASDAQEKAQLISVRNSTRKSMPLVNLVRKIPFLRRYRKILDTIVTGRVVDLLTELGVSNPTAMVKRYPHELSGGMQQRIVIAIALACHPRLLIADEPTSNLDVTIQAQILELIKELKKTKISSVLFITHDLGVVAEVCDRVSVMYAGDVAETALVRELFAKPLHPYTKGLLNSVPKVVQEGQLNTIPGIVPNLIHPPSGCRFHPRCPFVMDQCKVEKPAYIEIESDHYVACHLYAAKGETK